MSVVDFSEVMGYRAVIMTSTISRREFLSRAGSALLAGTCLSVADPVLLRASRLRMPIGVQSWDVRFMLMKNWNQGWAEVRKLGFPSIDWLPFAPSAPKPVTSHGTEGTASAKEVLQSLQANMSITTAAAKEVLKSLRANGIQCENCQFPYEMLKNQFEQVMEYSHVLGLKNIIAGAAPGRMKTVDDWKWQSEQLNAFGEKIIKAGFHPVGYHNHDFEFYALEGSKGVKPYDILMESTDPKLVKFQIDVGNLTYAGSDAYAYLTKYLDRYFSLHAKDYKPGWASAPVGKGILDWKRVFTIASKGHVENYFIEVGSYGTPRKGVKSTPWPQSMNEELRQSYLYLRNLDV